MTAQEGRPYCIKAGCYIVNKGENQKLLKQCRDCCNVRYIGCPGFIGKGQDDTPTWDWIRWWYHDIPIPDRRDVLVGSSELCPKSHSLSEKARSGE